MKCEECKRLSSKKCYQCFISDRLAWNMVDDTYCILFDHDTKEDGFFAMPYIAIAKEYYESFPTKTMKLKVHFYGRVKHVDIKSWKDLRKKAKELIDSPEFKRICIANKLK